MFAPSLRPIQCVCLAFVSCGQSSVSRPARELIAVGRDPERPLADLELRSRKLPTSERPSAVTSSFARDGAERRTPVDRAIRLLEREALAEELEEDPPLRPADVARSVVSTSRPQS